MHFLLGALPWQGLEVKNNEDLFEIIAQKKYTTSFEDLTAGQPHEFLLYFKHCDSLDFEAQPNYLYLIGLFQSIIDRLCKDCFYDFDWNKDSCKGDSGEVNSNDDANGSDNSYSEDEDESDEDNDSNDDENSGKIRRSKSMVNVNKINIFSNKDIQKNKDSRSHKEYIKCHKYFEYDSSQSDEEEEEEENNNEEDNNDKEDNNNTNI